MIIRQVLLFIKL